MSNVMSYLLQISDEFRASYVEIDKRLDEVLDLLQLQTIRIQELEQRVNANRNDNEE